MNKSLHHKPWRALLAAVTAAAILFPATTADAWWGPGGPYAGGWDPHEAYLDEYGFLDRHGPTAGDIRRMHRDNWMEMMGYPVHRGGVGLYGPTSTDVRRQYHRKARRFWGYPYW